MKNVTEEILPLATLAHLAVEAGNYRLNGKLALVDADGTSGTSVFLIPFDHLPEIIGRTSPRATVAFLFPDGTDLEDRLIRERAELVDEIGRSRGPNSGPWDTVIAHGGVRFRIYSPHGWLDEPEFDGMSNERLDHYIAAFSGEQPRGEKRTLSVADLGRAHDQWRTALASAMNGKASSVVPMEGSLEAGSIRDTVIVWSVGDEGRDTLGPRGTFIPPRTPPNPDRIEAALAVLAARVGHQDTVHALSCAAYIAWWCGFDRLATHLYYRVRSTGQRSRLAKLVWAAMSQQIMPPWMGQMQSAS